MKAMEKFTVAEKRWLLVGVALHKVVHPAICQALRTKAGHPEPYGCLDISAAVDRVCSETVFGDDLKKAATHLRSKVRNKWGHPVMVEWIDKEHFHRCFLAMRKVVDLLPYSSPAVRERTCRRLTSFEVADSMGNIIFQPYNFFPGGDNGQTVVVAQQPSIACCESCGYSQHPSPPYNNHPSDANGNRPNQHKENGANLKKASKSKFSWLHLLGGATMGFAVGILLASVPGKCGDVFRDGSAPIALKLQDMIKAYSHLRFSA
ncbi:uncharacterized protein [Branchiostoma lanceolatum]|uniref:uncharacterized protein isoform X2 n=1 Tax=Branchiostoma lanceolatum TaxID=7740 RepID=UPI003455FEA5